jgi:hypothetical protein
MTRIALVSVERRCDLWSDDAICGATMRSAVPFSEDQRFASIMIFDVNQKSTCL